MKGKNIAAVLTALCAAFLACGLTACVREDGFEYTLSEDRSSYTLIYYGGEKTDVTVPESHRGKPVTSLGTGAFACCDVTAVTLPDCIEEIGDGAFEGCASLERVALPEGISKIGDETFSGCESLEAMDIPESVEEIGDSAFYGCSSLVSVTFGNGLRRIGERAFCLCSSLTSVRIPASVEEMGSYAFCACASLTGFDVDEDNGEYEEIDGNLYSADGTELIQYALGKTEREFEIPLGVTSIGDGAFAACEGLVSVTLPDTDARGKDYGGSDDGTPTEPGDEEMTETGELPIYIGDYAFCGCAALREADVFDDVTRIGDYAFYGCSSLSAADISGNVHNFGEYAFSGCVSLTELRLGDGVTEIGAHSFEGCSGLAAVTIPENVTRIGECAFDGCSDLVSVTFENTNGWHVTTPGVTTGGTEMNSLSDPSANAGYLTGIYCRYEWYTA